MAKAEFKEVHRNPCMHSKSLQSCPTLHDRMDGSLLGSSVHGIFQARILEWVAMPSSRGLNLGLLHLLQWKAGSLPLAPPRKPRPHWLINFSLQWSSKAERECWSSLARVTLQELEFCFVSLNSVKGEEWHFRGKNPSCFFLFLN